MDIKKNQKGKMTEKNKSDLVLKKHVGLIHCENKLTLIQRKICNILLFNALDTINDHDIHEIPLKKLCSLVGYNSNDSKLIKESIKSLISTVMEWNLLEDSKFLNEESYAEEAIAWNASSLLAGATIKNGMIRYSYSPQMKSVLSSLEIYGRINLFVQAKFNSTYSLVLYENCVRFKNIKKTTWFNIDLFRSLMGVSEGKYASFKELKRNVINVAVNEINQKADICIEPHFRRTNRSITAIQFSINENENYQPSFKKILRFNVDNISTQQQAVIIEILTSQFGLSKKQAEKICNEYQHEYIIEKLNFLKSKKNVTHAGAYLLAALKEDYKISAKKSAKTFVENSYQREAKEASEIAPLKNKYMAYKLRTYLNYIQCQSISIQTSIQEKFEQFIKSKSEVFRFYKKSGFSSPFVMADFITFIDQHFPATIGEYLSFEDYITSDDSDFLKHEKLIAH